MKKQLTPQVTPCYNKGNRMSTHEKLIDKVMALDRNMRFDELSKVLNALGYNGKSPRHGSSHVIFRKEGKMPITVPVACPIKVAYVKMVKEAILSEEEDKS
jgi:predicted RNA binding protein YcfA (HicA-like mRNA interferase family)